MPSFAPLLIPRLSSYMLSEFQMGPTAQSTERFADKTRDAAP